MTLMKYKIRTLCQTDSQHQKYTSKKLCRKEKEIKFCFPLAYLEYFTIYSEFIVLADSQAVQENWRIPSKEIKGGANVFDKTLLLRKKDNQKYDIKCILNKNSIYIIRHVNLQKLYKLRC